MLALERIAATQAAEPLDPPQGSARRLLIRTGANGAAMRLSAAEARGPLRCGSGPAAARSAWRR